MKFYAEWKLQKKYTREEKIRYFKYTDLKTKTVYIDNCLVVCTFVFVFFCKL